MLAGALTSGSALADAPPPPTPSALPARLSMADAVRLARERGFEARFAEAAIASAEGQVLSARAIPNPSVSAAAGPMFGAAARGACEACPPYAIELGVADNGAISHVLSGRRSLRIASSTAALEAAKLDGADVMRTLLGAVKRQYVEVALGTRALAFVRESAGVMEATLEVTRRLYPGSVDEGHLARIEIQKLEADQSIDEAIVALRTSKAALALLLGARVVGADFDVDASVLDYRVPRGLAEATEQALVDRALRVRPDARAAELHRERAILDIRLAERERFPSIGLTAHYSRAAAGAEVTQSELLFGVEVPLPLLDRRRGEIRRARAELAASDVHRDKTLGAIAAEVSGAWAAFVGARSLVERMEATLLARAKAARDIVHLQYEAGGATPTDLLDAERTFLAIHLEYLHQLAAYWTAVFRLEEAVGEELAP